jgi:hypothetical protein
MSKIVAGLALALASVSAGAVVQAGVWIGSPQIDVFDLDLHDGFTAGYTEGGPRVGSFHDVLQPAPYGSSAWGAAEIVEADDSLTGHATATGGGFVGIGDRYAPSFTYTVTPRTRVTLLAPYRMRVDADEPANAAGNGGYASFELTVLAVHGLGLDAADDSTLESGDELRYSWLYQGSESAVLAGDVGSPLLGRNERAGVLSLSFDNPHDTAAVFAYRGEMVVWGTSAAGTPMAPPVPEPGTVALMLAGLGLVGWQVRRRRAG